MKISNNSENGETIFGKFYEDLRESLIIEGKQENRENVPLLISLNFFIIPFVNWRLRHKLTDLFFVMMFIKCKQK